MVKDWHEEEPSEDEEIRKPNLLISRTGFARGTAWRAARDFVRINSIHFYIYCRPRLVNSFKIG